MERESQTINFLQERVHNAVDVSLQVSAINSLGDEFWQKYQNARPLTRLQIESTLDAKDLKPSIPKGATVRILRDVRVKNPLDQFPTEEEMIRQGFGEKFLPAFHKARSENSYDFVTTPDRILDALPGARIIQKSGKWGKGDVFYQIKWTNEDGQEQWVYLTPQKNTKSGFEFNFLEVYTPMLDETGEVTDFSISYHFYKPEDTPKEMKTDRCYIIEVDEGTTRRIQVLRPVGFYYPDSAFYHPGEFEILLLGFEDRQTGKFLNVNKINPNVKMLSTTRLKSGVHNFLLSTIAKPEASMGYPSNPVLYISPGCESALLLGHEFGHHLQEVGNLAQGVEFSVARRLESSSYFEFYLLSHLVIPMTLTVLYVEARKRNVPLDPKLLAGGYGVYTLGMNTFVGERSYAWFLREEEVERAAMLFVESAKEAGVDLANGKLDSQLDVRTNKKYWPYLKEMVRLVTLPRIPLTKRKR